MWTDWDPHSTPLEQVFEPLHDAGMRFDRPWSISELRLEVAELNWLHAWFGALRPENAQHWVISASLNRFQSGTCATYRQMFGALLVCLGSEVCREENREDSVWPKIRCILPKSSLLQKELFLVNGQPSMLTKEMIIDAVRALNLRHAMDLEGTQQWFITIKLQFGFTFLGAKNRLAEWLVNLGRPHAVQYLNGDVPTEELPSSSFKSLWQALTQYRRGLIGEEEAREVVKSSPWVRSSWVDEILRESTSRIESLGVGDWDAEGRAPIGDVIEETLFHPVTHVHLDWPSGGEPRVALTLDKSSIEEQAVAPEIDIFVDNKRICRWLRQSNDTYSGNPSFFSEPDSNKKSPNLTPKTLTLSSRAGDYVVECDLAESGLADDVLVFDLDKLSLVRTAYESITADHHYAIVCDKRCSVEGVQPIETFQRNGVSRKALRLPTPLDKNFKVILEGFVLWQPVSQTGEVNSVPAPILTNGGSLPARLNDRVSLIVANLPEEADSVRLLIHNKTYDLHKRDKDMWATTSEVTLTPELASRQRIVRVRYSGGGRSITLRPKLEFNLVAAAIARPDGRQDSSTTRLTPLVTGDEVNRSTAGARLHVWTPKRDTSPYVYEGTCRLARARHGRVGLSYALGYGAALGVSTDGEFHPFGVQFVDHGRVENFSPPLFGSCATLELSIPCEPSEAGESGYSLWYWSEQGYAKIRLARLPTACILDTSSNHVWKIEIDGFPLAIALAWKGCWLGAWWDLERVSACIESRSELSDGEFGTLKWLRLPMLHPRVVEAFTSKVLRNPCSFLRAWLTDTSLSDGLLPHDHLPGADFVARSMLWSRFPVSHARDAISILTRWDGNLTKPERCIAQIQELSSVSPMLVWKNLERFLKHDASGTLQLLRGYLCTGLGLPANTTNQRMKERLRYLSERAANFASLEPDHLSDLVDGWIKSMHKSTWQPDESSASDLGRFAESPSGRQYIAMDICAYWLSLSGEEGIRL